MLVYHGSYCIIENPDITFSREKVDFGKGFYVTPLKSQAERWCEKFIRKSQTAYLNVYEFDESALNGTLIRLKKFTSYDSEWLDYVFACRKGENIYKQYDIVIGGIANDRIFATIDAYFSGYMSKEMALDKLRFEQPNAQICILSQDVLQRILKFKESIPQ